MSRQTRYRPNQSWTNPRPANLTIDRRLELAIGVSNSTRRPRDSSSNFCRRLERVVLKCAFCAAVDRWGRVCRGTEINSGFVGSTLAGWFDNDQRLIEEARRLRRVSGYLTINPVRSDLLARSDNRLSRSRHATRDDDILCLRWLYLDIDPIRPADISSTDVELLTAIKRRDAILGDHPELAACGDLGLLGEWCLDSCATRRLSQQRASCRPVGRSTCYSRPTVQRQHRTHRYGDCESGSLDRPSRDLES